MRRGAVSPRRVLLLSVIALFILAVTPGKYTRWLGVLRDPVAAATAPASAPMRWFAAWLRPALPRTMSGDPSVAAIEQERDRALTLWRQSQMRIDELERLIIELQRGRALNPELDIVAVAAPIVGASSDLTNGTLSARAGRDRGVTKNTVVIVAGAHLVGRIIDSGARTSTLLPVTAKATGWLRTVVDTGAPDRLPGATLSPAGDGQTLVGDLDADAAGVEVGQTVRLSDDGWPKSAQALIVGRVVSVGPKPNQPLRMVITVRPEFDLRRLSQVILLTPGTSEPEGSS